MGNIEASVLARLKNKSKEQGIPLQQLLNLFCQEEFIRRLSGSNYKENLILKGGFLLYSISGFTTRPTLSSMYCLVYMLHNLYLKRQNITQKVGNNPLIRDKIYLQIGVMNMGWVEGIGRAINHIEDNITEEISIEDIAEKAFISPFYFQKGFAMLCGFTVGEYIRQRRLTLAGSELISTDKRIIDIAVKYGYTSADSFTKAFTRFHGVTPTAVRKDGAMVKSFAPLKIKFSLEGGYIMDYKIVEKDSFTIMGVSRMFKYDNATAEIPQFWTEYYKTEKGKCICGMYGVCIDESMGSNEFEYLIADNYDPSLGIPDGFVTKVIPKHTWAVFACKGAMPKSLQDVNKKVYSEWLPNCKEYEIAAGYNVEMYTNIADYPQGNQDENYYSEIWIPVKEK